MMDYNFIKQLLQTIAEYRLFLIDILDLYEELGDKLSNMAAGKFDSKFYKYIHLLKDCGVIEEMSGNISIGVGTIRLKADGYEFYYNLCKEWFMAYVEKLPLSAAVMYSKAETVKNFGIS